jgi:hypothetical protein
MRKMENNYLAKARREIKEIYGQITDSVILTPEQRASLLRDLERADGLVNRVERLESL